MKKLLAIALVVAMAALSLSACGSAPDYQDGVYRAEAAEYSHDYKEFVEITIEKGKIASVLADAINADGVKLKKTDADYAKNYEGTGNDTTPSVFYPSLEAQLQKTKNPDKVEVVAGATDSSDSFKLLSKAALENAASGKTETAVVSIPEK